MRALIENDAAVVTRHRTGLSDMTFRWSGISGVGIQVAIAFAVLAVWQIAAAGLPSALLASPTQVAQAFGSLMGNGSFEHDLLVTAADVLVGFALVGVTGVPLGFVIGASRGIRQTFMPVIYLFNSVPTVALLPLVTIWFGVAGVARIAFILIVSEWALIINTVQGVISVHEGHLELATTLRLSRWARARYITFPGSLPYIFSGLRITMTHVLIGAIIAEQELGQAGLGGAADNYGDLFETANLIAVIAGAAVLAMLCFWAIRRSRERVAPWITATAGGQK